MLRTLLATVCREMVHEKKQEGAKEEKQMDTMERPFHGLDGYASVLDQLVEAKAPFSHLFNELKIENNREGNEEQKRFHS